MLQETVRDHPLAAGRPPVWASAWGADRLGPWCSLEIDEAAQRLRWIPPGQFLMGSPDDEDDRDNDEGPQHWVTISHGFWMFDTPCTQAFWEAVTGENPSQFKGPQRPVEQVGWNDCHEFIEGLNQRIAGLDLRLPTEAEWEYTCRAGNPGARYGVLDEVAWYGKNSGDSTHDVAEKQPNVWGLYDMLGNVYEWCEDHAWGEYTADAAVDPRQFIDDGAARVIRGGSWGYGARNVRAAYRSGNRPGNRWSNLGFRCLSSPHKSSQAARRQ
jgi:formylglycine-generating enzyme required for sulfatase activity